MSYDFTGQIAKGIDYLDSVNPNWRESVNPASLNMVNARSCVLGQVFGNYYEAVQGVRAAGKYPAALGFTYDGQGSLSDAPWSDLNQQWREAISATTPARFVETRTVRGVYVEPTNHFFFDGVGHIPGSLGRGNYSKHLSGALHGRIKVTALSNGKVSLRSTGRGGNGTLVHMSANTKTVIDGRVSTLAALIG